MHSQWQNCNNKIETLGNKLIFSKSYQMKFFFINILLEQLVHANVSKPTNTADITGLSNKHIMAKTCQNFRIEKSNWNIRLMLLINTLLNENQTNNSENVSGKNYEDIIPTQRNVVTAGDCYVGLNVL